MPQTQRSTRLSLPALFMLALFCATVLAGFGLSLRSDAATPTAARFVGAANYLRLWRTQDFLVAMRNMLLFSAITTPLVLGLGCTMAYLFRRGFHGRNMLKALLLLPWLISPIANGVMWRFLLNVQVGMPNVVLHALGFAEQPSPLSQRGLAFWVIVAVDVWRKFPLATTLLMPGFETISSELWDQLQVDGAGWLRRMAVAIALQRPFLLTLGVLMGCEALSQFDTVWVLTGGGPGTATTTLALYAYKQVFQIGGLSSGAATAWVISLCTLVIGLVFMRLHARVKLSVLPTETLPHTEKIGIVRSLIIGSILGVCLVPLLWTLAASFGITPVLHHFTWDNYLNVTTDAPGFWHALLTSGTLSVIGMVVAIIIALPAAHHIARNPVHIQARQLMCLLLLAGLPALSFAIPLREWLRGLNLLDTFAGVALAQVASVLPLCIYLLAGYVMQVDPKIEAAAQLDGADAITVLVRIVSPAIWPGLAATAIIVVVLMWNAFVIPLVLSSVSLKTVTVAMSDFFLFERDLEWGTASAALVVSLMPLVALVILARGWLDKLRLT